MITARGILVVTAVPFFTLFVLHFREEILSGIGHIVGWIFLFWILSGVAEQFKKCPKCGRSD